MSVEEYMDTTFAVEASQPPHCYDGGSHERGGAQGFDTHGPGIVETLESLGPEDTVGQAVVGAKLQVASYIERSLHPEYPFCDVDIIVPDNETMLALVKTAQVGMIAETQIAASDYSDARMRKQLQVLVDVGKDALGKAVLGNIPLVLSRGKRFRGPVDIIGSTVDMFDLISAGIVGLHKAVEKFNPDKGKAFVGYAILWIDKYINKELNSGRKYSVSSDIGDTYYRVRELRNNNMTVEEIAEETGEKIDKVLALLALDTVMLSLDSPFETDSDSSGSLSDILPTVDGYFEDPEEEAVRMDTEDRLWKAIGALPDLHRLAIIYTEFGVDGGGPLTCDEAAVLLDCSPSSITNYRIAAKRGIETMMLASEPE